MGGLSLLREAAVRWVSDGCYRLAASLAYYALFSLFPLLLLSVTILGFVLGRGESVRHELLSSVSRATSPVFLTLLDETLTSMQTHLTARGVGAVVGAVALLFGASSVFSELQFAMNVIWRVKEPPSPGIWSTVFVTVKEKAFSFAIVAAAALTLLASLIVNTLVTVLGASAHGGRLERVVSIPAELVLSVGFLTVLFAAIYRSLPRATVLWRDVTAGALLTAVLLTGLKRLFAMYLGHLGGYAAYGAVGAVLGLLTWIYLAGFFLYFGAEVSRVYAERYGSLVADGAPRGSAAGRTAT